MLLLRLGSGTEIHIKSVAAMSGRRKCKSCGLVQDVGDHFSNDGLHCNACSAQWPRLQQVSRKQGLSEVVKTLKKVDWELACQLFGLWLASQPRGDCSSSSSSAGAQKAKVRSICYEFDIIEAFHALGVTLDIAIPLPCAAVVAAPPPPPSPEPGPEAQPAEIQSSDDGGDSDTDTDADRVTTTTTTTTTTTSAGRSSTTTTTTTTQICKNKRRRR